MIPAFICRSVVKRKKELLIYENEKKEIQKQCIKWCKKETLDSESFRSPNDFTKNHLEEIASPRFEIHDIIKQTIHDNKEYPIFFIRARQISERENKLTWVYFGSLFDIQEGKVCYKTTTSYISEKYLESFD